MNEQLTLCHAVVRKGQERANHKYVARVKTGNTYRYFYTMNEYNAYRTGSDSATNKPPFNGLSRPKHVTSTTPTGLQKKSLTAKPASYQDIRKKADQANQKMELDNAKRMSDTLKPAGDALKSYSKKEATAKTSTEEGQQIVDKANAETMKKLADRMSKGAKAVSDCLKWYKNARASVVDYENEVELQRQTKRTEKARDKYEVADAKAKEKESVLTYKSTERTRRSADKARTKANKRSANLAKEESRQKQAEYRKKYRINNSQRPIWG